MNCKFCGKPLHESQYSNDGAFKSCPRCSTADGEEHIFFPYPSTFGYTSKRSTSVHKDGPQSYCVPHRGDPDKGVTFGGIRCSDMRK